MDPMGPVRAAEAWSLAGAVAATDLPAPLLPGWQGLCAAEYAIAVQRLRSAVDGAAAALAAAAGLVGVGL